MKLYYFRNREDSLGLNYGTDQNGICIYTTSKEEQDKLNAKIKTAEEYIDNYIELPDTIIVVSQETYKDILSNPGNYIIDKNNVRKVTDSDIKKYESEKEKKESVEKSKPENIRIDRTLEFEKYTYYMQSLPWEKLTEKQKSEYKKWYESWLAAPETKKRPDVPKWFKEK
jgi:hypothetical protein